MGQAYKCDMCGEGMAKVYTSVTNELQLPHLGKTHSAYVQAKVRVFDNNAVRLDLDLCAPCLTDIISTLKVE